MKAQWLSERFERDRLILAGDVGGTNTTLALVGEENKRFTIILKCLFESARTNGIIGPIEETLREAQARDASLRPDYCCVSGAGPIKDNFCRLSNIEWNIDGNAIEEKFGFKTLVINDFAAISFSLPLLDIDNPESITPLPHPDGSLPPQTGYMSAVVGAGTGLGVGFLLDIDGKHFAPPSEGGHISLAGYDEESRAFENYMAETRFNQTLEAELFVSGQGIAHLFHFFKDVKRVPIEGALAEIDALPDEKKPPVISKYAASNETCAEIMRFFVRNYAKAAGDVSACLVPRRGMYLAGGIVTKNERFFVEDNLFMRHFEACYHPNIQRLLKTIPVYIVKDYSVSLLGAANAARSFFE